MTTKGDQDNIAVGFTNVDESETKIPEGIMKPMATTFATSGDSANIAAGEPVAASGQRSAEGHVKIPEGIMTPTATTGANPRSHLTSTETAAGNPNVSEDSANLAAGDPVDASGKRSAEGHAKIPEGIMKATPMS